MIRTTIGALLASALLAGAAQADCLDDAAVFHGVSPSLLRSIAMQESGMKPWVTNRNANGSEDIGLMQINTIHLPRLARYGITRAHLFNGCTNAYVGAWILRENIHRFGPTWKAVGAYNAASPDKQLRYANKIHARWQALQSAALR
ncbi:Invasion protein iagB [Cupriavidus necator]|uniref:Invasion protein iagB n=1 Tax=Cupriavidus necator TaxID=106590 RepID=A0A1K0IJ37_CUPNE|nr:Invasion protein iagB [Cupriavidus necator]